MLGVFNFMLPNQFLLLLSDTIFDSALHKAHIKATLLAPTHSHSYFYRWLTLKHSNNSLI